MELFGVFGTLATWMGICRVRHKPNSEFLGIRNSLGHQIITKCGNTIPYLIEGVFCIPVYPEYCAWNLMPEILFSHVHDVNTIIHNPHEFYASKLNFTGNMELSALLQSTYQTRFIPLQ